MKQIDSKRSYHIIINKTSGTALQYSQDEIEKIILESGIGVHTLHILPPQYIQDKLNTFKDSPCPILVGGGDGTIRHCAEYAVEHGKTIGIIPLGTMNLLSRDLELPLQLSEALSAYAGETDIRRIDAGHINGHIFLCCAALGAIPKSSILREKMRERGSISYPQMLIFTLNQLDEAQNKKFTMAVDGQYKKIKSSSLVISNNPFQSHGDPITGTFKRETLSGNKLAVYSARPRNWWSKMDLLFRLGAGNWKSSDAVTEWKGRDIIINSHDRMELVSLDGEAMKLKVPLKLDILPKSLSLVVPQQAREELREAG